MAFFKVKKMREMEIKTFTVNISSASVKAGHSYDCDIEGYDTQEFTRNATYQCYTTPNNEEGFLQSVTLTSYTDVGRGNSWSGTGGAARCSAATDTGVSIGVVRIDNGGDGQAHMQTQTFDIDMKHGGGVYAGATSVNFSGYVYASTYNVATGYCTGGRSYNDVTLTYLVYKN
jgi:hypothetical protein